MAPADPLVLRTFRPADQAAVRRLILDGLEEHWGTIDETLNPDLDDLAAAYPDGRTVLAERDGRLVAAGTVVRRGPDVAEILRMSVTTSQRRTGVGRRVLEELVGTARAWSMDRVVLETNSDWTAAVAFYLACGFVVTGTTDGGFGEETWFERRL